MARLTPGWLYPTAPDAGRRLMAAIHPVPFESLPTLPLGQFFHRTAYRDGITGILPGSAAFFWNVRRA